MGCTWGWKDNGPEPIFSFHHVDLKDQLRTWRLVTSALSMSHLTSLSPLPGDPPVPQGQSSPQDLCTSHSLQVECSSQSLSLFLPLRNEGLTQNCPVTHLRWCPWVSRAPSSLFVFLPSAFFILAVRSVSLVIICPLFSVRSWILGPSVGLASPVLRGHLLSEGASWGRRHTHHPQTGKIGTEKIPRNSFTGIQGGIPVSWEQGWGGELACLATISEHRPEYDRQIRQDTPPPHTHHLLSSECPQSRWDRKVCSSSLGARPLH